jgi:putative transcriptional regulator
MTTHSQGEPDEQEMARLLSESMSRSLPTLETRPRTRQQLLDLLEVPRGPIERAAYPWLDVGPGLKLHVVSEDQTRGVKRCLVWGAPGASTKRHGHSGDELILVLEGQLKDDRGSYGPGEICRSSAGDVHQEQVEGDRDCICFVVYYGDLIPCS